jgi:hypothetical protein
LRRTAQRELERFHARRPPPQSGWALLPLPRGECFVGAFDPIERGVVQSGDQDLIPRGIEGLSADRADREGRVRVYFFELPLPDCPGGPVWSWLGSPFPQPGRVELVLPACSGTVGVTTGLGVGDGGGVVVGGGIVATGGAVGGGAVRGLGFGGGGAVRGLGFFDRDGAGLACGLVCVGAVCLGVETDASSALGCDSCRFTAVEARFAGVCGWTDRLACVRTRG